MIRPDSWEPSPGINLEPNARKAIEALGVNAAIAAGPGAGKTELLAQRANFLFTTGAIPPTRRIIAISFKVDAAKNLRERVSERCHPLMSRRFDSYTFHAFARTIIARHRVVVADKVPPNFTVGPTRTSTQVAYSELLPLALRILKEDARAIPILRQSYSFAFFDEFQDCTVEQFQLIKTIFGGSDVTVTAVGDSKQRIMGWAGALEDAMSDYLDSFSAQELPLYQNHRSLKRIRRVQNSVIKVMDPHAALADEELASSADELASDGQVRVLQFADAREEAEALAAEIARDIQLGFPPSEIAILLTQRTRMIGAALVQQLADHGVPIRDEHDAQDVFAEPVGELILAATKVLVLGRSPNEFEYVSEFMTHYCVDELQATRRRRKFERFLADCRRAIATGKLDLTQAEPFRNTIYEFLKICERQFLSRLSVDYGDDLVLTTSANAAVDLIIETIGNTESLSAAMSRLSQEDAVRLLTVHKSKGLEFDHVYFMAVEKEMFFNAAEDNRSTFFVGISRPRSRLTLTHVGQRDVPGAPWNWRRNRAGHAEFIGYAMPEQS